MKVKVCVELPEEQYRAFARQARDKGVPVEMLVAESIQIMLSDEREREKEEQESPIIIE